MGSNRVYMSACSSTFITALILAAQRLALCPACICGVLRQHPGKGWWARRDHAVLPEPTPGPANGLTARRACVRREAAVPPPHLHWRAVPGWLRRTLPEIGCILIPAIVRDAVLGALSTELLNATDFSNFPNCSDMSDRMLCLPFDHHGNFHVLFSKFCGPTNP